MTTRIRLQKAIAHAGLMSRRAAEELIAAGRVTINDRVAVLGDRVDVEIEHVAIDGALLPVNPTLETYLLYKPVGVISTADDPRGRPTVVEIVDSNSPRLYPVGRLDADSEGLLLLTNDGALAERVTHPRYGIRKVYLAEVAGLVSRSTVKGLERGVELEDGPARALRARLVGTNDGRSQIEIIMGEGRKREVRRMMDALGYPMLRLVRTAIGPISDPNLKPGQWRRLTSQEIAQLMSAAKAPR